MSTRELIFLAAGGLLGAFTGILGARSHYKKKYENDISDIREFYSKKKDEPKKETNDVPKKEAESESESNPLKQSIDTKKNNYTNYAKDGTDTLSKIAEKEGYGYLKPTNKEMPYFPRLISEDEYTETNLSYSKDVLHYYAGDKVITDEEMEVVVDAEELIGPDVEDYFEHVKLEEGDYDSIYIRNDELSRDFEIDYHDDSFFYGGDDV